MAAIDQNIIGITRSAYGVYLQTIKNLGRPFTLIPNTTLNEKLNIQAGVLPPAGQLPSMQYMAIGNLGHMTVVADDGSEEAVPIPHRPTDASLWGMIPFVLRRTNDDLPANIQALYGLRRTETHNNETYFAYYARRLDFTNVVTQLQQVEVIDGVATTTPYVPTTENLNPTRPDISNTGVVLGSNSSVSASAVTTLVLNPTDIAEILNAHRIRTGSTRSPVISEIGLVSGVDREVAGSTGGSGSFNYTEILCAQINVFISTYHALGYSTNGATFTLDVGGVEPLLGDVDINNAEFL